MLQGPGLVVSIEVASESRPATAEADVEDADRYSPRNVVTEKLADGWLVRFENEGSMGKNYFVHVRRDIGGKSIWCETTASQPEQGDAAAAACKSVAP